MQREGIVIISIIFGVFVYRKNPQIFPKKDTASTYLEH